MPHNLIREKLINLIEWTFIREGSPYIACNERQAFFTLEDTKRYKRWSCQNVCEALIYLLDNIYIRFGTKLYRHIVGIPMGINCALLVADLFLFCYDPYFEGTVNRIYPPELQLNKLIPLIPKPHFWICIYLFQTDLFHLTFMISAMTLILI